MKLPLLCVLLVISGVIPTQSGILNLNKMIKQVTGKIPFFTYWFYGCHCGPGGKGHPKDATDWCCRAHDCCYALLKNERCCFHTDNYRYDFLEGEIQCSDKGSWCEKQLCACDKTMALCLQESLHTYNKRLRYYWRPRCQGQSPECWERSAMK
ncbi:group IID secretory phospholipase A2 [Elephas maximus indicus]|uniref:group IID secretory phospholipase A2 n=1 Tax=Elephas maximus indicus TaxID=99487 RepID=UPI002115EA62|nr:group IID secretory phospholipase A2 [Elephas maximus indicus]